LFFRVIFVYINALAAHTIYCVLIYLPEGTTEAIVDIIWSKGTSLTTTTIQNGENC